MEVSTVVIKVKYGDMLRRFNAQIVDEQLDLTVDELREKIISLFGFAPDSELMLTYLDEDGDVVNLVDDVDLCDVVKQGLNPLRITVKLTPENEARQFNHSRNSTPLRSPSQQQPLQNLHAGVSEILKTVPEPLRETLVKLSNDLASIASAPVIIELVDYFSKVGLSYLGQLSESQTKVQPSTNSDIPESSQTQKVVPLKDWDPSKVSAATMKVSASGKEEILQPEATMENNQVKPIKVTEGSMETSSPKAPGSKAASSGRDCRKIRVCRKGKVEKTSECYSNEILKYFHSLANFPPEKKLLESSISTSNLPYADWGTFPSEKEVNETTFSNVITKTANINAPDSMKGTHHVWGSPGSTQPNHGSSSFPVPLSSPNPEYKSPFSGIPVGNASAAPSLPASKEVQFSGSNQNDVTDNTSHWGVICDGCEIHPITGPRFKSKVKYDYDLCSMCFAKEGNSTDYIRLDSPMTNNNQVRCRVPKTKSCPPKLDCCFIQDVNIIDGTIMPPLTRFTKIWRMRNSGMVAWPQKTQLVWVAGDIFSNHLDVEVKIPAAGFPVGEELDITVDFISPERPGHYKSYWRMISPSGKKFGRCIWIQIQVVDSLKEIPREVVGGLNLNFPPVSRGIIGPGIVSMESAPIVEDNQHEPDNSKRTVEIVEPVVDLQPNNVQEMKFPNNYSFLFGNGGSSSVPLASRSVPYTIASSSQESAVGLTGKEKEEKLHRELEEMGFIHFDVNEEILRKNEYDLAQAVDDLCGITEWDPILEELHEMGFHDTEMNKMLLEKNNGSIKRVVMDLIGSEDLRQPELVGKGKHWRDAAVPWTAKYVPRLKKMATSGGDPATCVVPLTGKYVPCFKRMASKGGDRATSVVPLGGKYVPRCC